MSSSSAVLKTASISKTVRREVVWATGAVVKVTIPQKANAGSYLAGKIDVPYIQFPRNVRGGVVNLFVHSDEELYGKTITAAAAVMRRVLDDGREYFYIDLLPLAKDTPVTHRLSVVSNEERFGDETDWTMFQTPNMDGLIIFSPPEAKVYTVNNVEPIRPAAPSTGDSQLDRLIQQGWQIEQDYTDQVLLSREKKGEKVTMTHFKRR